MIDKGTLIQGIIAGYWLGLIFGDGLSWLRGGGLLLAGAIVAVDLVDSRRWKVPV